MTWTTSRLLISACLFATAQRRLSRHLRRSSQHPWRESSSVTDRPRANRCVSNIVPDYSKHPDPRGASLAPNMPKRFWIERWSCRIARTRFALIMHAGGRDVLLALQERWRRCMLAIAEALREYAT